MFLLFVYTCKIIFKILNTSYVHIYIYIYHYIFSFT